ncbi:MAG TPA: IclR family transcriptional regulator C-terminal domain-containing protein, partial [Paraburkholderia sp.]
IVELDGVNAMIDRAAEEGFAIVEEEFVLDGVGIAMPICDATGMAIAALDVGCVASRYAAKRAAILAAIHACIAGLPLPFSAFVPSAEASQQPM